MCYVDERVSAKPYGDELAVICTTNRAENEQDWKGIQFISTAAVLMILLTIVNYLCKYMCEIEIHVSFLRLFGTCQSCGYLLCLSFCRLFGNRYEKVTIILPSSEKWAGLRSSLGWIRTGSYNLLKVFQFMTFRT